jgi:sortase A
VAATETADERRVRPLTARIVGAVGRVLIAAGVLVLLFVAYQLWGTGLHEERAQKDLDRQFQQLVHPATTTPATIPGDQGDDGTVGSDGPVLPAKAAPTTDAPSEGEPVGRIEIPKMHVDKIVVQGVGTSDLERGPGHYPQTPLPGQAGNAAIAGHRTTYGAPFFNIDKLGPGDEIFITTVQGRFTYRVTGTKVVAPSDVSVLDPHHAPDGALTNELTLTACHPKWSANKRIIVSAMLAGNPVPQLPGQKQAALGTASLSGNPAGRWPALLWGLVALAVALVAWFVARRWSRRRARMISYALSAPVFLVVLFIFFENVSLLLPPNF